MNDKDGPVPSPSVQSSERRPVRKDQRGRGVCVRARACVRVSMCVYTCVYACVCVCGVGTRVYVCGARAHGCTCVCTCVRARVWAWRCGCGCAGTPATRRVQTHPPWISWKLNTEVLRGARGGGRAAAGVLLCEALTLTGGRAFSVRRRAWPPGARAPRPAACGASYSGGRRAPTPRRAGHSRCGVSHGAEMGNTCYRRSAAWRAARLLPSPGQGRAPRGRPFLTSFIPSSAPGVG